MKTKMLAISALALLALNFSSCKKDKDPEPTPAVTKPGALTITVQNVVGKNTALKMDGTVYKNQNGDDFTVSKFNYYISNIKFIRKGSIAFTEAESYHLIEQSDVASLNFTIDKLPAGDYDSIRFTLGVDSLRNVSGAQSGALDPAKGMFWSWSTGYIMFKLEGTSPQSTQAGNNYQLHAGGFKGVNNVLREITLPCSMSINGNTRLMMLTADVQKALGDPNPIDFSKTSVIMSAGASAKALADNYQNMFSAALAIE